MYIIFYANGFVCIVSGQINLLLYPKLGMKTLVLIVQTISIFVGTYIVLVQQHILAFEDEEKEQLFVNISIPVALLFLSCSIQVGFTAVVQSAYQDERIFPFKKKATGINIIILVSKVFTIGAPFVNELDEPIPIIVIICLAVLSIIIVLFFKSKTELDKMKKVKSVPDTMSQQNKDEKEE